jgi:hypothetical protein
VDAQIMDEVMKLVIGWTIVVAFLFTTVLTCLSLIFKNIFAKKTQQHGLYVALILELVVGTAANVSGKVSFNPERTAKIVQSEGAAAIVSAALQDAIETPADSTRTTDKAQLERWVGRLNVVPGTAVAEQKTELEHAVRRLPAGRLKPEDVQDLRDTRMLRAPQGLRLHQ